MYHDPRESLAHSHLALISPYSVNMSPPPSATRKLNDFEQKVYDSVYSYYITTIESEVRRSWANHEEVMKKLL